MNRTCPVCGSIFLPDAVTCVCGRRLQGPQPRKRLPVYLAVVPLILPVFFMFKSFTQLSRVSAAIGAGEKAPQKANPAGPSCVYTYGITLSNSHEYVPQQGMFPVPAPQDPNKPREIATVLHGTVSNTCGEDLKEVVLHITVRDETGSKGAADYSVGELKRGVNKDFEHAWMGRVTNWDIHANQ